MSENQIPVNTELFFENEKTQEMQIIPYTQGEIININDILEQIEKYDIRNGIVTEKTEDCGIKIQNEVMPQLYIPKGISASGAQIMWNKGITGADVVVAVVDTGIADHPDLKGKVVIRRVYTGETSPPNHPHGTHVAGTIAANGTIKGIAYDAQLGDYRALNNAGSANMNSVVSAIYQAVEDGCSVINLSLGGPSDYPPLRAAIQYAYNMNVAVIAAAGNSGDGNVNTNEYSYPAMYPTTVSVGAVDYNGINTKPAAFTVTNLEVDCSSQGVNVLSTYLTTNYVNMSGTSMAAPHIAGIAALLIQQYRLAKQTYTTTMIYSQIKAYCKDVYIRGFDNATGHGFVTFNTNL